MPTHRSKDWFWTSPATEYLFIGYPYLATTKPGSMINLQLPYHFNLIVDLPIHSQMDLFQSDKIHFQFISMDLFQSTKILLWIFYPLTMDLFQSHSINGSVSIRQNSYSYIGTYFSPHNSKILGNLSTRHIYSYNAIMGLFQPHKSFQ